MAPRKSTEKPHKNTLDLKPKRGVRKRTQPAKFIIDGKVKTPLIADTSSQSDVVKNTEITPQKANKSKVSNKTNVNGMKTVKDYIAVTSESRLMQETPSKYKKTKAGCKNAIESKNVPIDEVIDVSSNPESSPLKNKKKVACKQKNDDHSGEAAGKPPDPDKMSKGKRAKPAPTRSVNQKKMKLETTNKANIDKPTDSDGEVPPKTKKSKAALQKPNHNDIKIMLANEVIRRAFSKRPAIEKNPIVKNRPRRQKKTICKPDGSAEGPSIESKELAGHDASQQLTTVVNGSSEPTMPKKRINLSLNRNRTRSDVNDNLQITDKAKGKNELMETGPNGSNVVLNHSNVSAAAGSTSKCNYGTESHNASNITCRKNSGTSTSTCYSWTKDISSSSTTTCITVQSNDFVRIDNKLPVVKLTNVDHKIKRKDSFDSRIEKAECPSESDVSISNLNISHTLNLSTSSLTSVTPNKTAQNDCTIKSNTDERLLKLQRSIENLACKMKNFDLEIINWIGYENDSQDAKVENIHSRIIEVLHEESEVIKYCQTIKQVLVGDQRPTNAIEECRNEIEISHPEGNAMDNSPVKDCSKDVIDNVEKPNKDVYETVTDIRRSHDTKIVPAVDETFTERISCDKDANELELDNDDDDALSLFAESITGLESSRKNSSFATSIVNDKSVTRPNLSESNRRLCERSQEVLQTEINNVEKGKEPDSYQSIHNVRKQTADSSTILNNASENNVINKFQAHASTSTGVHDRYNNKFVHDLGVSRNLFQNINSTGFNNKTNNSLFSNSVEFPDAQNRSANKEFKNFNDRQSEFQNPTGRLFPSSFESNFNVYHDNSEFSANLSEKWNNGRISEVQGNNSNEEFVGVVENSVLSTPSVEQIKQLTNKEMHVGATNLFKGICFYNLASNCKNVNCNFIHKHLDLNFVKSQLLNMSEDNLIRESMFVIRWPILKRKYGICIVEECLRRNMNVWGLHLVKDFICKINRKNRDEATFLTEVTEAVLLHLNDADLQSCADILRSNIKPNICMCDHLMKVISETQNFTRFKNIFIKLTLFICQIGRSFRLDVATQVLERLCILPYDDALARALMKIIAKTNPSIFSVPMMGLLESQLSKNNIILYQELMSLKLQTERYGQSLLPPPMQSPRIAPSNLGHQTSTPRARADSPDTTNTDFVNKVAEPVITRTITINRTINTCNLNMSAGSESSDEHKRYEPRRPQTSCRNYPPRGSLRFPRQVYRRPGFTSRAPFGTPNKFRRRAPQGPH